jgi:hypothetical protein
VTMLLRGLDGTPVQRSGVAAAGCSALGRGKAAARFWAMLACGIGGKRSRGGLKSTDRGFRRAG